MLHIVRRIKILAFSAALAALLCLTACGQKGPLYLPGPAAQPAPAQK